MVKLHSAVFYFVSLKIGEFANLLQAFSARFQDMKSEESSKGEHTFSISINCVFLRIFPSWGDLVLKFASLFGTTCSCVPFLTKLTPDKQEKTENPHPKRSRDVGAPQSLYSEVWPQWDVMERFPTTALVNIFNQKTRSINLLLALIIAACQRRGFGWDDDQGQQPSSVQTMSVHQLAVTCRLSDQHCPVVNEANRWLLQT